MLKLPFITQRKHIEICVYSSHGAVHEASPISHSAKSQFMGMEKNQAPRSSVSSCYGFMELAKRGALLKSWMDWKLVLLENGQVSHVSCQPSQLSVLNETRLAQSFSDRKQRTIIKVAPPIKVECKESIPFVVSAAPFFPHSLAMPSGVTDFKHQHELNFFFYADSNQAKSWDFSEGDELLVATPLSDRPIKVINLYDKAHYSFLHEKGAPMHMHHSYRKKMKRFVEKLT